MSAPPITPNAAATASAPPGLTNAGAKPPMPALTNAAAPPTTVSHFTNASPVTPHAGGAKKSKSKKAKATTTKKHLCGRDRLVTKEGRSSFVVIKGTKVSLTKAKELDAKYKKAKKEAEAKKPKAAKKTRKAKSSAAKSATQRTTQKTA